MKKIETKEIVQAFLNSFLPKFDVWGIFFIDRKKNDEAMAALGITPAQREDIIREIKTEDYIETIVDEVSFGDMWVFGKDFSGEELYIKISLGPTLSVFHFINQNFQTNTHSRRIENDKKNCRYRKPFHRRQGIRNMRCRG